MDCYNIKHCLVWVTISATKAKKDVCTCRNDSTKYQRKQQHTCSKTGNPIIKKCREEVTHAITVVGNIEVKEYNDGKHQQ